MEAFNIHNNDITALLDSRYTFDLPWSKPAATAATQASVNKTTAVSTTSSTTSASPSATSSRSSRSSSASACRASTSPPKKRKERDSKEKDKKVSKKRTKKAKKATSNGEEKSSSVVGTRSSAERKAATAQDKPANKSTNGENGAEEGDLDDLAGILVGLSHQPSKEDPLAAAAFFASQRKKRRRTSPEELDILENTFKVDPMPNQALRQQLAQQLGMTPRRVQIWFQNKRAKLKRTNPELAVPVPNKKGDGSPTKSAPTSSANTKPASTASKTTVSESKKVADSQGQSGVPVKPSGAINGVSAPGTAASTNCIIRGAVQTPAMVLLPTGQVAHAMIPLRPVGPNGAKPALSPLQPRPGSVSPQAVLKQMPSLIRPGSLPGSVPPAQQLSPLSASTASRPAMPANRAPASVAPTPASSAIRPPGPNNILPAASSTGSSTAATSPVSGANKSSPSPIRPATQRAPVLMSGIPAQLHPHLMLPANHHQPQQPQPTT